MFEMAHATRAPLKGNDVSFFLGVILFVVVVGVLDARLPWPSPKSKS
jgi:hypothetical protein